MNTPTIADIAYIATQVTQAAEWEYLYRDYCHQEDIPEPQSRSFFARAIELKVGKGAPILISHLVRMVYAEKGNCYSTD